MVHQAELVAGIWRGGHPSFLHCVFSNVPSVRVDVHIYAVWVGSTGAYGACVQGPSWWPAYGGGGRGVHIYAYVHIYICICAHVQLAGCTRLSWWPAYGGGGRGGHPTLRRVTRPPGPPVRGAGVTLPPRTTHSSSTQGGGISTKHKIENTE